jgi:heat-inducible transcriptional repressor
MTPSLTERERQVLEAVVETYVETAEPAGSRTIAKRFGLALSAATIRNTMSDLEAKGYLYHPHTSAGRIPTDLAYRVYVDSLMHLAQVTASESHQIREELAGSGSGSGGRGARAERGERAAVDQILERAAQVLGVLTKELGVAVGPSLDEAVLERLELLQVSSERLLLVLTLKSGMVRTIFVEVPSQMAPEVVRQVALVLNERLAGLTLREIRDTLPDRVRDAAPEPGASELLNIFIQEADELFDMPPVAVAAGGVVLGSAQLLAGQPEFATKERLQELMAVTERRDLLREALAKRLGQRLTITIGAEHGEPNLAPFTLVTASYRLGPLAGVIGVMGPTRMPYDKIVALVDHTSRLVGELLE